MTPYSLLLLLLSLTFQLSRATRATRQACSYNGLFVSERELSQIATRPNPTFETLFKLTKYTRKISYSEQCGVSSTNQLTKCEATHYNRQIIRKRSANTCHACCRTVSSISIPNNVTDLYSGQQFQATHYASSYQLLNLGTCANAGADCGYQGTCVQATRIQWILVNLTEGTTFVPTVVPSHCTCIYT